MAVPMWLIWIGVVAFCALCLGGLLCLLAIDVPPENRPAPPTRIAANDQARLDALQKIAARNRRQEQREASARLTRGW